MTTFVVLSSCNWGSMLQRPHHLARSLARLGHPVHFIEPSGPSAQVGKNETFDDGVITAYTLQNAKKVDGVDVYSPLKLIRDGQAVYDSTSALVERLLQGHSDNVIIAYLPRQATLLSELKGGHRTVYDCVDDHSDFEFSFWSSLADIEYEAQLLGHADTVLTTSSSLYVTKCREHVDVHLSKNAVSLDDLRCPSPDEVPPDLQSIPSPRAVYVGAVEKWFDEDLFYQVAQSNQGISFVVIGPVRHGMLTKALPNLHLLGIKKHSELGHYLKHMDAGLIPFRADIDLIIACDPIKVYEYLAAGLPVVSTPVPELCLGLPYVSVCNDVSDFSAALNRALTTTIDTATIARFLEENSWEARAKQLVKILSSDQPIEAKQSILNRMRTIWELHMVQKPSAILMALVAQTYMDESSEQYLASALKAYQMNKNSFTTRVYVHALLESQAIPEAIQVAMDSAYISDLEKAELASSQMSGNSLHETARLLHLTRRYAQLRRHLSRDDWNDSYHGLELANYFAAVTDSQKAYTLYHEMMQARPHVVERSPVANQHLSDMLGAAGRLRAAEEARFQAIRLTDQLLNRESRFEKWQNLFTEEASCDMCGCSEQEPVVVRPDNQAIVKCPRCGLVHLARMPQASTLPGLYDQAYFHGGSIAGYQQNYHLQDNTKIFAPRLRWIQETHPNTRGGRLLDVGCSDGQFLQLASQGGWNVIGVEVSPMEVQRVLAKGIPVVQGDLRSARFDDGLFDCVTLWDVVEHFLSPRTELREIGRILKPGGRLYLSTPNHHRGLRVGRNWFGYNASYEHLYYFDPHTLCRLLMELGFTIDSCFSHEPGDWAISHTTTVGHILLVSASKA